MLSDQLIELIERNNSEAFRAQLAEFSPKKLEAIINSPDSCDNYPIHAAVKINDLSLIKWLLSNGANPTVKNFWGSTPLDIAIKLDLNEAARLIEDHKPSNKTEIKEAFVNKDSLEKDFVKNANEQMNSLNEPISGTQHSGPSSCDVSHSQEQTRTQKKTNNLLKILVISNISTALLALGSMYFSFQAMESAGWAASAAQSADFAANNAEEAANYIKRWGVDCN